MKDTKETANWLLAEIKDCNPYTSSQRHLAFVWSTGFLARIIAELIWRDSDNLHIVRRILDRQSSK